MKKRARIIIAGDIHLGGGRIKELALQNRAEELFGDYLTPLNDADLTIANLESPAIDIGTPIPKTGPSLKTPVASLQVLKTAGVNLLTLANNHMMDYGVEGLNSTLQICKEFGFATVGAGNSLEEASASYHTELNGLHIAVINIAENEFGTTQNGAPGGHPMNPVRNFYTIRQAKASADFVLVIVHGGHEHFELPSPRMVETYRFFADAGADAVIGHHTHCISGYEVYNNVPILYSLGNFLFDKPYNGSQTPWHRGVLADLSLSENGLKFDLIPYIQNADQVGLRHPNAEEKEQIETKIEELNNIIQNPQQLLAEFDAFCDGSKNLYSSFIEPHSVRILHALRNRNILPSVLSAHKKRLLLNLTRCESHRDVLIKTLTT